MPFSPSRRRLLLGTAALPAATLAPSGLLAALAKQAPPLPDLSDWTRVRAQFALDPAWTHFASFFLASHPAPVRAAIDTWRRAIDQNPFAVVERALFESEEHNIPLRVQDSIARYLGGERDDVCLTRSTTESLALVYHGLPLRRGDEVLTTTHDHYSHHESIRLATQRAGASMRKIALFDDSATATVDGIIGRLLKAMNRKTRVVGVTWVHSSSGIRLPIPQIAEAIKSKRRDVLLVVDGVHGLGAVDEAAATMGADFFCAGCHKWMFAPRGTGILWANAGNWARLRPTVPSFSDLEAYEAWMANRAPATPNTAARMTPGGFHAYEHQWAMAAAFEMHLKMGRARVAERIRALNDQLKTALADHPKIHLRTPISGDLSAGLVAFDIDGLKPEEVVKRLLERKIIASTSPYAVSHARLAPSLVNTTREVERAAKAVRDLAK